MTTVQEMMLEHLRRIEDKLDNLKCVEHGERLARTETKVRELNDIRQLVRSTVMKWGIPLLLSGLAGGSFLHNLFS